MKEVNRKKDIRQDMMKNYNDTIKTNKRINKRKQSKKSTKTKITDTKWNTNLSRKNVCQKWRTRRIGYFRLSMVGRPKADESQCEREVCSLIA
jgi:hypothetical protein